MTEPKHAAAETTNDSLLTNKLYDLLKYISLVLLPAIATLYAALASIWHFPKVQEVVVTITSVDTFIGVLLAKATKSYNNSDAKFDGSIDVIDTGVTKQYSLTLNSDPQQLDAKSEVTFKVNPSVQEAT